MWSVLSISTAIKTALKVALLNGQLLAKVGHRTKSIDFVMGLSVKFVLPIIDAFSNNKGGGHIFSLLKKNLF